MESLDVDMHTWVRRRRAEEPTLGPWLGVILPQWWGKTHESQVALRYRGHWCHQIHDDDVHFLPLSLVAKQNRGWVLCLGSRSSSHWQIENVSDKTVTAVGGWMQWLFLLWRREMRRELVGLIFLFGFFFPPHNNHPGSWNTGGFLDFV